MLGSPRNRFAAVAAVLSALVLSSCSNDPIVSSVRPTKEDMAGQPQPAPAGSIPALMRTGEAMRQAGDLNNALGYFRRAHQIDLFDPAPLVKIGVTLNDLGQYNEAVDVFNDALALDHNNTEALRGLGTALIGLNQPALAMENLNAALAIEPDYRTYNALGVATDHLGDHQAAQRHYNEGLRIFPNNLTLLNNLGLSQILSGDLNAAIDTLVTAAQLPGSGPRQRQNLALAYGLSGRDQEAARILRLDLDNQAIQSNLAYYGILRAADDAALTAAVMGVHVPANAPAPPPVQASELPADAGDADMQPAEGPAEDFPSIDIIPEAGPGASQPGTAPKPGAQAAPPTPSRVITLQTRPEGGAYQSNQIKDFSQAAEIESQELAGLEPAAGEPQTPAPDTQTAIVTEPAQPTAETESAGQESGPPAVASAAATAPQTAAAIAPQAAPDAALAESGPPAQAAESAPPPITTGYSDLAPAAASPAAAAPAPPSVPTAQTSGPPIWYAEPQIPEPSEKGQDFLKAITDFLFGPSRPQAPGTEAAATAPAAQELAAIQPAAGAPLLGAAAASDTAFESRRDLTARYLQRLDSVRAADPPRDTGLSPNPAP